MAQNDQFIVFRLGVHAIVGLHGGGLVDGVFGVVEILLAEDLHDNYIFY